MLPLADGAPTDEAPISTTEGTCGARYCAILSLVSMCTRGASCRTMAARPSSVAQQITLRRSQAPAPKIPAASNAPMTAFSCASLSVSSWVTRCTSAMAQSARRAVMAESSTSGVPAWKRNRIPGVEMLTERLLGMDAPGRVERAEAAPNSSPTVGGVLGRSNHQHRRTSASAIKSWRLVEAHERNASIPPGARGPSARRDPPHPEQPPRRRTRGWMK
mmetsp:Transcript_30285/g.97790  ORF Transcript_30285/g.97790 Transcript_30285/m.97790 type:complete len:218 (+) Transcript_30285:277-930(+)